MILTGKLIKDANIIRLISVEKEDEGASYRDVLEDCFVELCRKLDIPVPLWLRKNTKEFVSFRRTFFTSEQFMENITFDKFEIRVE